LFNRFEYFLIGADDKVRAEGLQALEDMERIWSGTPESRKGFQGKRKIVREGVTFLNNAIKAAYGIGGAKVNQTATGPEISIPKKSAAGAVFGAPFEGVATKNKSVELGTRKAEWADTNPMNEPVSRQQLMKFKGGWEQAVERQKMEKSGWTEAYIAKIDKILTSGDLKLMDLMRQWFRGDVAGISRVSSKTDGVPVELPDPMWLPMNYDEDVVWNPVEAVSTSASAPKLQDPKIHGRQVDTQYGLIDLYTSQLFQHAHYQAFAEIMQDFRSFLGDQKALKQMERKWGKPLVEDLIKHVTSTISDFDSGHKDPFFSSLLGFYSTKALSYNRARGRDK